MLEWEVLVLFFLMVFFLDLLQQLPVSHKLCTENSEGWTGVPPPDVTELGESDLHVPPSSVEEEVPENLGHEWRVLHPFEFPRVRHPTDATPPNQRRLVENDALIELIQTTEYLEDIPMWGQRDYQLYPPRYGDPFYRGRGRGRGRGRREMMNERPQERDST